MKIFIDAGHNYSGSDTGAEGYGLREQDVTFYIAERLKDLLISAGHEVKMSREKLTDNLGSSLSDSLNTRVNMANRLGMHLFISIHCNAYNGVARGTETLVYSFGSQAAEYAERIQKSIITKLGTANRGVKERSDLVVLRKTSMPAVLVETAFIDNKDDAELLRERQEDFAQAIFEGIAGERVKEETVVEQTVMKIPGNVYVQEMSPDSFRMQVCDCRKRHIGLSKYFNAGFFSGSESTTVPIGNLACGGEIMSQAKDNAGWINVAGKKLTTIYTTKDGGCGIVKTDSLEDIPNLKEAVSGIPIIVGGRRITMEEIKAEGYFGNETYNTWHGFLGLRHGKLCYVAMKSGFDEMCWTLVALGIYDAIKLDGGGSFILHDGKELEGTGENRRIHNVGVWEG